MLFIHVVEQQRPRYQSSCESTGLWCDNDCVNGADGASGSKNTSKTSFVKIYKIG